MGIRYFACDYEADTTDAALADPRSILSPDYLESAQRFAETLVGQRRGMVYTIG